MIAADAISFETQDDSLQMKIAMVGIIISDYAFEK
jgi:hypothetical protein